MSGRVEGGDRVALDSSTDQELLDELKRRDDARKEAQRRQAQLEAEMRRSHQEEQDAKFAEGFGLTVAQLGEIQDWLDDDERFYNLYGYRR